ncbi:MAG: hypothetical protein OXT65_06310 [Alphaproteobacteria bacterium]|nr:hypothetical protein [Alphaproteobacteria bacterium]
MKRFKISHRLAAAMTVGAIAGSSTEAFAGGNADFQSLTNNVLTASDQFQNLISFVGYIGGSGLAVAGIFKLKQHVDQPAQHPMKDGLIRLGAGGALLALPFMTRAMQGSISNGVNTQLTIQKLDQFSTQAG